MFLPFLNLFSLFFSDSFFHFPSLTFMSIMSVHDFLCIFHLVSFCTSPRVLVFGVFKIAWMDMEILQTESSISKTKGAYVADVHKTDHNSDRVDWSCMKSLKNFQMFTWLTRTMTRENLNVTVTLETWHDEQQEHLLCRPISVTLETWHAKRSHGRPNDWLSMPIMGAFVSHVHFLYLT